MWTPVGPVQSLQGLPARLAGGGAGNDKSETLSFKDLLEQAFEAANQAQWEAERAAAQLATGQIEDLHRVTILAEKANLSLQLMISIRNKVIEAYQEISRMQV